MRRRVTAGTVGTITLTRAAEYRVSERSLFDHDRTIVGRGTLASTHLFRLASPSLPIGAFAYSGGLEPAVEAGWVHDEASARTWVLDVLEHAVACHDLPILFRLHAARRRRDAAAFGYWDAVATAGRDTDESSRQDEHLGTALRKLVVDLGVAEADTWLPAHPSSVGAFAFAAVAWDVDVWASALAFGWSVGEAQVHAAVRLVPLGQTAGQRILGTVADRLHAWVETAAAFADDEIGASLPALAIMSGRHRWQYCRLFRS